MGDAQSLLILLIAAVGLVRLADVVHVPSPIVLVIGGGLIALIPGLPRIILAPDLVFFVFLPPLVHSAGWYASPQELRAVVRPLALLAVGLVLLTAALVAAVAHALVPGMDWAEAAVLGAVLAPTDAVAATATFSRLGAPERTKLLAEGESMINDATALVLFRIAVGAAAGEGVSMGGAVVEFFGNVAGGVAMGLLVGWIAVKVAERQSDTALVVVITVLTAYGSYVAAEEIHASGVLAAVTSGLYTAWYAPRAFDADTRLTAVAFWRVLVFALEVSLFVLLGLQLPDIVDALRESSSNVGDLVLPALAVTGGFIALRLAFVFALRDQAGETAGERFVLGWSGMKGAVSLAAALAVPLSVGARPEIVVITFAGILVTLVGEGLTLPIIIRRCGLERPRRWSDEEAVARLEAAQSALDRLDELEEEGASEEQLRRLRDLYRARFRTCMAVLDGQDPRRLDGRDDRAFTYGELRRELISVERETLLGLRDDGRLRQQTVNQIQRDLDLDEARIRI
jgi:Na+/H+ antiporter